jgi:hypothetical protein
MASIGHDRYVEVRAKLAETEVRGVSICCSFALYWDGYRFCTRRTTSTDELLLALSNVGSENAPKTLILKFSRADHALCWTAVRFRQRFRDQGTSLTQLHTQEKFFPSQDPMLALTFELAS